MNEWQDLEKVVQELGYQKRGKYWELEKNSYTHQVYFMKDHDCIRAGCIVTGQFDTNTYNSGVFRKDKLDAPKFKELLEFFLNN